MATTIYGSVVQYTKAYVTYETVDSGNSGTTFTIKINSAGLVATGWSSYNRSWTLKHGSTVIASGTKNGGISAGTYALYSGGTVTINKGTSAKSESLSMTVTFMSNTTTASTTISVPALTNHLVEYNGNAQSGATVTNIPSSQRKWTGTNINLRTTVPTSTNNYTFSKWNTKTDGTGVSYSPGQLYTANGAGTVNLYAIWSRSYIKPTITNAVAKRCDSTGNPLDDGTNGIVTFNYTPGIVGSTSQESTVTVEYKLPNASSYTEIYRATDPASPVTTSVFGSNNLSIDSAYDIRIKVSDTTGSITKTTFISQAFFYIDVSPDKGVAIGKSSSEAGTFEVGIPTIFSGGIRGAQRTAITLRASGNTWTAPSDGIVVTVGRANANDAYLFIRDTTLDLYAAMTTLPNSGMYGTMIFFAIKDHVYSVSGVSNWNNITQAFFHY